MEWPSNCHYTNSIVALFPIANQWMAYLYWDKSILVYICALDQTNGRTHHLQKLEKRFRLTCLPTRSVILGRILATRMMKLLCPSRMRWFRRTWPWKSFTTNQLGMFHGKQTSHTTGDKRVQRWCELWIMLYWFCWSTAVPRRRNRSPCRAGKCQANRGHSATQWHLSQGDHLTKASSIHSKAFETRRENIVVR